MSDIEDNDIEADLNNHENKNLNTDFLDNIENIDPVLDPINLKVGSFIVVQFPTKKTIRHFIGTILEISKTDDIFRTKFLRKSEKGYSFPVIDDISDVTFVDIMKILSKPTISRRGYYSFQGNMCSFNL